MCYSVEVVNRIYKLVSCFTLIFLLSYVTVFAFANKHTLGMAIFIPLLQLCRYLFTLNAMAGVMTSVYMKTVTLKLCTTLLIITLLLSVVAVPWLVLQEVNSSEHVAALLLLCSLNDCIPPPAAKIMSVRGRLDAKWFLLLLSCKLAKKLIKSSHGLIDLL